MWSVGAHPEVKNNIKIINADLVFIFQFIFHSSMISLDVFDTVDVDLLCLTEKDESLPLNGMIIFVTALRQLPLYLISHCLFMMVKL